VNTQRRRIYSHDRSWFYLVSTDAKRIPHWILDQVPARTPDWIHNLASDRSPDRTPDRSPDRTPDRTPDWTTDRIPDRTPDYILDWIPDTRLDWILDWVPDWAPDWSLYWIPGGILDWTPDWAPNRSLDWSLDWVPCTKVSLVGLVEAMAIGVEAAGGVILAGLCSSLSWRLDSPADNTHILILYTLPFIAQTVFIMVLYLLSPLVVFYYVTRQISYIFCCSEYYGMHTSSGCSCCSFGEGSGRGFLGTG